MEQTYRPERERARAAEARIAEGGEAGLAHVALARHYGVGDDDAASAPAEPAGPAPRLALRQAEGSPREDFGRVRAGAAWLLAGGGGT